MDIWDIALGFMDAQVMLTSEKVGLFDAVEEGRNTVEEVAASTGLPEDSALRLLSAVAALGLVERRPDGTFANHPEASDKLVRSSPGYIGSMFEHVRNDLYPLWGHLREALEEGRSQWDRAFEGGNGRQRNEEMFDDPEALRRFMEGMHAITYRASTDFAGQARELLSVRHVVDVGGASGAFLIALAERFSGLRGTVLDLPPVKPITEEFVEAHGLSERIEFRAGDFWEDELPEGADAYSLGFILHDWDTRGGSILLDKVARAAPPGALLIVGEFLFNEDRTGPLFVARQDLNMLVAARGRERSVREYRAWLRGHGFLLERVVPASDGKHFMIARKNAVHAG